ncbi:MAG TPA: hypothetical protein VLT32_24185 [Candidatus Sulfomarinibacteraceae bacterium]|nr:hypothetical protein [Candidatus Sulfomarinibacteraceae bacterium]
MTVEPALRCERCRSVLEVGDLRCAVCNLTCPETLPEDRPTTAVDILRCSGCGASMTYDVRRLAAACAFCGSVLEVEHPEDPVEEARVLVPFAVDRAGAEAAFRSWLGGLGWFRPGDLRSEARLETIQSLRWAAWVFDARATVSWTADSDAGARRADWAPHAGQAELELDDVVVPATRGLTEAEVARLVPSYDLAQPPATPDAATEAGVESFDTVRSVARQRLAAAVEALTRRRLLDGHVPGRTFRNLHTAVVLRGLDARRCALPAWVLAYRYRGRLFRAVLSGQDPDCLVGSAPYSVARIVGAAAAALGLAVALAGFLAMLAG